MHIGNIWVYRYGLKVDSKCSKLGSNGSGQRLFNLLSYFCHPWNPLHSYEVIEHPCVVPFIKKIWCYNQNTFWITYYFSWKNVGETLGDFWSLLWVNFLTIGKLNCYNKNTNSRKGGKKLRKTKKKSKSSLAVMLTRSRWVRKKEKYFMRPCSSVP